MTNVMLESIQFDIFELRQLSMTCAEYSTSHKKREKSRIREISLTKFRVLCH